MAKSNGTGSRPPDSPAADPDARTLRPEEVANVVATGGFALDAPATFDGSDPARRAQLQMEQAYLRIEGRLFGKTLSRRIAHYDRVRAIGEGAMGVVWEAIDLRLNREVALKLLKADILDSERGKPRLLREARAMAKISHPNVVAVYEVGESDGIVYIAMEYVRGMTMRKWLAHSTRSLAEILDVFVQAGAGLAAAHHAEIIHRDFKPDNVLIGDDNRARVLDFGLAFPRMTQALDASPAGPREWDPTDEFHSTSSNVLVGTIAYMSPEQLHARAIDARSDQFGFCVALHEAIFGRRPFTGRTFHELVDNVWRGELSVEPAPPRHPSWLIAMLRRGLATAREDRYASMTELVSVLAAGRQLVLSQRVQPPVWSEARDHLLSKLACTFEEQVTASPGAALIRVQRSDGRRLVVLPHDPRAAQVRATFAAYFERFYAGDAGDPPSRLRPSELVDDDACVALVFDDLECVTLGGLIRQTAGRDIALALQVAAKLVEAVHALAQLGYALDPAALETIPVGVHGYAIGPIDPSYLVADATRDPAGRYRIVGAALLALVTTDVPDLAAVVSRTAAADDDERALPAQLGEVIDRLLDPVDGYRSARGVDYDLAICLTEHRKDGTIGSFPPGTRDVGGRFRASSVVRGRERELGHFETVVREVSAGSSGLALVSGPSGIGKTLLLDEMGSRLERGWRTQGKFDQYANNEPYATLTQALRGLIRQILDENERARGEWRERIVRAVAPNAELLFSVIPELRGLIGDQPAAAVMPPVESAARFGETLKRLLLACAAQAEVLVVVLDDMQWCDRASVRLICSLLADREVGHILWICAFRDGELPHDHPLHELLAVRPARAGLVVRLPLGPLSLDDLQAFLADTLGCPGPEAAALATFFRDKTDGNPLFARTLLSSLHDQGLFTFSGRHEAWRWDDDAIRSAELPGDIQELIGRKIGSLSAAAREILTIASCVGRDVEAAVLVDVVSAWDHPRDALAAAIRECVACGLLASIRARTPGGDGDGHELLNFTHDRVQQTAYHLLTPDRRGTVLLAVGRALLDRSSPDEIAEKLFRIVGYLNAGAGHADAALRDRIVELNLRAARRALIANAFADSARFLQSALELLPDDRWTSRYEQTVELYVKSMQAQALLGHREDEDALFELLRKHVRTGVHLGQIYELKVMLESSRGEHRTAIARGVEGLRELGEKLGSAPSRVAALTELARTAWALRRLTPDDIERRPSSGSVDAATSRLLIALSAPAYLADSNLLAIVMMRIVRRSLQFGMSDVSPHGFAGFGLIVSGLLGGYRRARSYAMIARRLDERFGNPWLQPKVDLMSGIFILPWTQPFEDCEDVLRRGARVAADNADFVFASYNATSIVCLMYYRGEALDRVVDAAAGALRHTHRARDFDMEAVVTTVARAGQCLRGETASPIDLSTPRQSDRDLMAALDERTTPIGVFFCRAIRCGVLYIHGRADLVCELGAEASAFEANAMSNPSLAEYLFYYAMGLLRRWPELTGRERRAGRALIKRALKQFEVWARHCPANFASRRALLAAEVARVRGRGEVLGLLNSALEAAVRHDRVHYEALAAELAAAHCAAAGQSTVAHTYLGQAWRAYARWGATVKAKELAGKLAAGVPALASGSGNRRAPIE